MARGVHPLRPEMPRHQPGGRAFPRVSLPTPQRRPSFTAAGLDRDARPACGWPRGLPPRDVRDGWRRRGRGVGARTWRAVARPHEDGRRRTAGRVVPEAVRHRRRDRVHERIAVRWQRLGRAAGPGLSGGVPPRRALHRWHRAEEDRRQLLHLVRHQPQGTVRGLAEGLRRLGRWRGRRQVLVQPIHLDDLRCHPEAVGVAFFQSQPDAGTDAHPRSDATAGSDQEALAAT